MAENLNIPANIKVLMTFINRVGFPILAFLLMFGLCIYTLLKLTPVVQRNTEAVISVQSVLNDLKEELRDIRR